MIGTRQQKFISWINC